MSDALATVQLEMVVGADSDREELAELTARLRRELLELDVEGVDEPVDADAPPGTKGLDAVAVGTLVVTLERSVSLLRAIAQSVQGWLTGQGSRTVKLQIDGDTIELTGASSRQQERLVDAWIQRHARE